MCSLNFYMLYIQGYILCISIVSEEPPCENLFVGYYIKNGEKGLKCRGGGEMIEMNNIYPCIKDKKS